ncbi:patatin-like phospholipase family protein [Flavobacterium amniphilum]|uniref:patatin-like phospholipase family protein n=1 Tax=Flavobacterium amniphilum TaxID=1834035 RepID=UPI002029CD8E|nr:patatin-like phospholipase family protein [Flavobacterium amniphilum]MCL9805973.1 patatin-like phospholipase family protein [Flavobacterium amniphilum]
MPLFVFCGSFIKAITDKAIEAKYFCLWSFLFFFSGLIPTVSSAQDTIKKPKIGLVLSGGGAKGLAHIGVLKEIEKAGIKIDYIGGTSMGAIVGGLYACGYTANELDSIFSNLDSDAIIQDVIPRSNKTFYEKNNDEVYALTLPFQNLRITVPKGFSKGLYNYNLFSKLTHNYRHVRNFNELKIPFLCIATDVETGEEVVFREGSLPLCLAASGAFPSLFSPVEIDGRYYIDGGVVNNYPIEEVKRMGADIIIGVDVQDGLKTIDNISGATGVLVQISNFKTLEKMNEKAKMTDVYIKPNIKGFSVISFDLGGMIIKNGEQAAQKKSEELKALGSGYKTVPQKNSMRADSLNLAEIHIEGYRNYTRSYFLGKLRFKPGYKISYNDLHNGFNNLNATQNFTSIKYKLAQESEKDVLMIDVQENPIKTFLKLGVHYDDLFKSAALINVTKKNLIFKNDVISADFILGDNIRYNLDYYIDNGFHWSFGLKSNFEQFNKVSKTDFRNGQIKDMLNKEAIDLSYNSLSNKVYLQTIFAQKFLIGGGLEHNLINIESNDVQTASMDIDNSSYYSAFGFLKFDSFTNKYFPKKGWYFFGDFQSCFYSTDYNNDFSKFSVFKADMGIVQTVFKKLSLKAQTEGGFTVGEGVNHIFDFVLGGYGFHKFNNFRPFYGYNFLDLHGDSYVKGSVGADYEFVKKNHLSFTANFTNIGDKIFDNKAWFKKPDFSGYALGYGLETLIGPVEVKHSWSPDNRKHYTWFSVGFWF